MEFVIRGIDYPVYIDELPMVNPPIVPFTAFILEMSQVSFMMQLSKTPLVALIIPVISAFLARKKPVFPFMRILQFKPFGSGLFLSVVLVLLICSSENTKPPTEALSV